MAADSLGAKTAVNKLVAAGATGRQRRCNFPPLAADELAGRGVILDTRSEIETMALNALLHCLVSCIQH